ncbi:MAG: hypothetical protein CMJ69_06950 [Planctomycetaceae bacterium]|nr:hypothetical protein [Planctomycetaceae bacterium]
MFTPHTRLTTSRPGGTVPGILFRAVHMPRVIRIDRIDHQRLLLPLYHKLPGLPSSSQSISSLITQRVVGRLAHKDLRPDLLVGRLDPSCRIDRVSDRGVVQTPRAADGPNHRVAGVDAHADPEVIRTQPAPSLRVLVHLPNHLDRRNHRILGMIGIRLRRTVNHHHTVTEIGVEHPPVRFDRRYHDAKVGIEQCHHFLWSVFLGERRKIADVGEQHGHFTVLALEIEFRRVGHQGSCNRLGLDHPHHLPDPSPPHRESGRVEQHTHA